MAEKGKTSVVARIADYRRPVRFTEQQKLRDFEERIELTRLFIRKLLRFKGVVPVYGRLQYDVRTGKFLLRSLEKRVRPQPVPVEWVRCHYPVQKVEGGFLAFIQAYRARRPKK